MKNASASSLFKPLGKLFRRFHLTLFFVLIIGCLAVAVLLINITLTGKPSADDYVSPIQAGTIDEATLQRIQSLHPSSEPSQPPAAAGRSNPFSE